MHEGVLLKSSIAQFWTELETVTSLLWGEPSSIKSTWKCGSCSSAERAATWSEAERGQESANSALAAFRKQQQRVHRIVMDYVQGLKSGSRAKNELTTSWRKGRSWKWVPCDTNSSSSVGSDCWGQQQRRWASCNHSCNAMMKPVESFSSSSCLSTAQSRCGRASYEIRMKRPGCVFSSLRPQSRALPLWQVWKTRLHICFSSLRIQDFSNFVALKNFTNPKFWLTQW